MSAKQQIGDLGEKGGVSGMILVGKIRELQERLRKFRKMAKEFAPFALNNHLRHHWGTYHYICGKNCLGRQASRFLEEIKKVKK